MKSSTLHKLLLSRSLYELAKENGASTSGIRLSIACNLLQDSVECFLLALADHHNAEVTSRTVFDQYFELINAKIAPRDLPLRSPLISLNKLRVNSKHFGLEPSKPELDRFMTLVWEFLTEVTNQSFGKAFPTISLLDMMKESEAKELLQAAVAAFESNDYVNCMVACRQAIFVKFECQYDARRYLSEGANKLGLLFQTNVPYYARDPQYLAEHVKEPTDYVIYDHNRLEMELLTSGVDSVAYWNVWRLTPEVYRESKTHDWIIKQDFHKLDANGIRERAEYVLLATTEVLLAADQHASRTRRPEYARFHLTLKRDAVTVYEKASKQSKVTCTSPVGMKELESDYIVGGLDGPDKFWHVSQWGEKTYVRGFVHEADVDIK